MFDLTAPHFKDEDKAREYLEALRWPNGPVCPHCGAEGGYPIQTARRAGLYKCKHKECRKQFTVTVGTVFERSKIPLTKWLMATYLMCSSKKGISSHQLHRMLGVQYKTAWFMTHRIREAMREGFDADFAARIQKELTPTETCYGTVEGILEALNLHAGANRFTIFPVSVERGITCYIPESLHDTAIRAVRHKVAVTGKLKFRPRDMLPSEVDVEDMTTFPPDSELPTFADLRGMAPQMTGDKSTEEYLAEIRDAWN